MKPQTRKLMKAMSETNHVKNTRVGLYMVRRCHLPMNKIGIARPAMLSIGVGAHRVFRVGEGPGPTDREKLMAKKMYLCYHETTVS